MSEFKLCAECRTQIKCASQRKCDMPVAYGSNDKEHRPPTAIEVMLGRVLVDALQGQFDYLKEWARDEKIGMHNGVPVVWLDTVTRSAGTASSDRERAAQYIHEAGEQQIGSGDDPVGFLIASHAYLADMLKEAKRQLESTPRSATERTDK